MYVIRVIAIEPLAEVIPAATIDCSISSCFIIPTSIPVKKNNNPAVGVRNLIMVDAINN
ncbi:hypothetical protein [Methanosphaera stadtmanae]|uniref:hypothetical protein n=1 Tax=Methanosphaera stadtmanae TaxID=2317 RepID=UPI0026DBCBCA|nr:hypothetical protein [Methanosphaera stadtmanae]